MAGRPRPKHSPMGFWYSLHQSRQRYVYYSSLLGGWTVFASRWGNLWDYLPFRIRIEELTIFGHSPLRRDFLPWSRIFRESQPRTFLNISLIYVNRWAVLNSKLLVVVTHSHLVSPSLAHTNVSGANGSRDVKILIMFFRVFVGILS